MIFSDQCINNYSFYKNKKTINIDEVDIKRILLSEVKSYGDKSSHKYYIGYICNDGIKSLKIKFPKMTAYTKCFDNNNKCMIHLANDEELLQKYNNI